MRHKDKSIGDKISRQMFNEKQDICIVSTYLPMKIFTN